jgi:hypothetical protein
MLSISAAFPFPIPRRDGCPYSTKYRRGAFMTSLLLLSWSAATSSTTNSRLPWRVNTTNSGQGIWIKGKIYNSVSSYSPRQNISIQNRLSESKMNFVHLFEKREFLDASSVYSFPTEKTPNESKCYQLRWLSPSQFRLGVATSSYWARCDPH